MTPCKGLTKMLVFTFVVIILFLLLWIGVCLNSTYLWWDNCKKWIAKKLNKKTHHGETGDARVATTTMTCTQDAFRSLASSSRASSRRWQDLQEALNIFEEATRRVLPGETGIQGNRVLKSPPFPEKPKEKPKSRYDLLKGE